MGGRDTEALLRRARIDPATLDDASAWVPLSGVFDCWRFASEEIPEVGLRVAEAIDFSLLVHLDALTDYLYMQLITTCRDVAEGLVHLEHYAPISFGRLRFTVERDSGGALVRFAGRETRQMPKDFVNFALTFPMRAILQTASRRITPSAVFLPYPKPASLEIYERLFNNAQLHFGAATAGYRLAACDLSVPLIGVNPEAARRLRMRADDLLQELTRESSLPTEIRALIRAGLRKGDARAPIIARRAGLSVRMLARRLEEHGVTYRALVDDVRSERAQELLRESRRPLREIAEAVGFSDTSSFQRAFRRWCGKTPGEYRASKDNRSTRPC